MKRPPNGLLDTSVLIASESGRELAADDLPEQVYISVITIGELQAGVLAARDTTTRARRLATLDSVSIFEPLPVDATAAHRWAAMRVRLADASRRINVNDLWIASIASANALPVVTQDADYDVLEDAGGPPVIKV